jgi:hypothetical protein
MTNEEAIKKIKAKLECMDRQTRGIFEECNSDMCDSCDLNYAQGNMGEQKEALRTAIKALKTVERIKARRRELEKKLQGSFSLSEATEHYALTKLLREADKEESE